MAIAEKNWKQPYGSFLTLKLILEGSYAFVLFLQWIYNLTNERNLENEHFGRNYFNFGLKIII